MRIKLSIITAVVIGAFFAVTASAFATGWEVSKGSSGEGKGVFTAEGSETKCAKVKVATLSGVGKVEPLEVESVYAECTVALGFFKISAKVTSGKFKLSGANAVKGTTFEVPSTNTNEITIEGSGCKIVNEANQTKTGSWENNSTGGVFKIAATGIKYKAEGCEAVGIKNGAHENGELKEEVTSKGVKHT